MILISLIIPIYNVQDYIERCLDSIICQESEDFGLECILVNDSTPDGSMRIIERRLDCYSGKIDFIVINHEVNKGLSASRNTGLKHANGDFIFFIDSDDRLEEGALNYMVDALQVETVGDLSIDVVIGNTFICKNEKKAMSFIQDAPFLLDNTGENALRMLLNRELYHIACNKLVRRKLLLNFDLYFKEGIIDEDMLWSYLVFLNAESVLVLPKTTYIYEDNPTSIMNTTSKRIAHRISSRIFICKQILDSPPRTSLAEYYMYVFYIFIRAINLYELNRSDEMVRDYSKELFMLRNRLLDEVLHKRLVFMYMFFLTSKKPLYALTNCRLYRRYYDKIAKCVLLVSK